VWIVQALGEGSKGKVSVVGTAIVDIGALASIGSTNKQPTNLPVTCTIGGSELEASFGVGYFSAYTQLLNFICIHTLSVMSLFYSWQRISR
jgi:hypothetical protein